MTTLTLNVNGIKFDTSFNTVVTKVTSPEENSSITLASLPGVSISLGGKSAAELKLEKDTQVTIKPVADSTDGSFELVVGEKAKPQAAAPASRGSGSARSAYASNSL